MRLSMLLLCSCALIAAPTAAQTSNRGAYAAEFYMATEPRTALDMIQPTPGFIHQEGDTRRGYKGSFGNVFIDGPRAVSKAQTLTDGLQPIPAAQVARIEILRGSEVASDTSGFASSPM